MTSYVISPSALLSSTIMLISNFSMYLKSQISLSEEFNLATMSGQPQFTVHGFPARAATSSTSRALIACNYSKIGELCYFTVSSWKNSRSIGSGSFPRDPFLQWNARSRSLSSCYSLASLSGRSTYMFVHFCEGSIWTLIVDIVRPGHCQLISKQWTVVDIIGCIFRGMLQHMLHDLSEAGQAQWNDALHHHS